MALLDAKFELSDAQSVSATAQSTNIIDFVNSDLEMGAGNPYYLNVRVEGAASAGTSLTVVLHNSSTTDIDAGTEGSTNNTVWSSGAIPIANLIAGAWITRLALPNDVDANRYVGLQYTASGTLTGCTVNAWLDNGPQSSYDTQVAESNI
jgi:hypothetical protein